jgi:hypothetical protein
MIEEKEREFSMPMTSKDKFSSCPPILNNVFFPKLNTFVFYCLSFTDILVKYWWGFFIFAACLIFQVFTWVIGVVCEFRYSITDGFYSFQLFSAGKRWMKIWFIVTTGEYVSGYCNIGFPEDIREVLSFPDKIQGIVWFDLNFSNGVITPIIWLCHDPVFRA